MHDIDVSPEVIEAIKKYRGKLHCYEKLDKSKTALIVIDMQNDLCEPGGKIEIPRARGIVPNINRLAQKCREAVIPVIWIEAYLSPVDWKVFFEHIAGGKVVEPLVKGGHGGELYKEMNVREGDLFVEKCRFSCFVAGSSNLERLLRSLGRDTLILTGAKTDICVESTARDAMQLDFKVIMVKDATATLTDKAQQASLEVIFQRFGDVMSTGEVIEAIEAK